MTDDDRAALVDAWNSPGGFVLRKMLDDQSAEPKDELWEIMARRPDTLTGKSAVKLASRSKALVDFRESIEAEIARLSR